MSTRELKLLRVALDARTPEGEATAALIAFRRLNHSWITTRDLIIEGAVEDYERDTRVSDSQKIKEAAQRITGVSPSHYDPEFWFGKYKGCSVSHVAQRDKPYLRWVLRELKGLDADFREALEEAL